MRTPISLAVAALLAGCAYFSDTTSWTRSGVTPEQAEADVAGCKRIAEAQLASEADIEHDRSAVLDDAQGAIDTEVAQSIERERFSERFEGIVDDCMRELGYAPAQ